MLSLWQAAAAFVLLIACANVAYLVSQQRHDIGVRMALGATGRDVLRMTIGQSGRLAAIGILLGALASVVLGRSIESGLLGIATSDMRLLALLAATLGTAALAAAYIPARRAASTDPMLSLRGE
jgi:ABC-type antimicrobial peptide transport system permease subunit